MRFVRTFVYNYRLCNVQTPSTCGHIPQSMRTDLCIDIGTDMCIDTRIDIRKAYGPNVDGHVGQSCSLRIDTYSHSSMQMLLNSLTGTDIQLGSLSEWGGGVAC